MFKPNSADYSNHLEILWGVGNLEILLPVQALEIPRPVV